MCIFFSLITEPKPEKTDDMGTRGNYNGKLSEKDELIKSLRDKQGSDNKVDYDSLNKSIKEKRQILEDNNVVQKDSNTQ